MHGRRDRPVNPHIYILLINPDYHFIIGLRRLPRNKVTLPNELKLQFTIGALFPPSGSFFFFSPPSLLVLVPCGGSQSVSSVWSLSTLVNCLMLGSHLRPFMGSGKSVGVQNCEGGDQSR